MEKNDDDQHGDKEHGEGGSSGVDNSIIISSIKNCLPSLMREVMDANMAMEERLTTTINNMTKRLEYKIELANVTFSDKIENLETVQEGFANQMQDFEDRICNVESTAEANSGLHEMVVALARRIVSLEFVSRGLRRLQMSRPKKLQCVH